MMKRVITRKKLAAFEQHLQQEEKSTATIRKYLHDVRTFAAFLDLCTVLPGSARAYKDVLLARGYKPCSINSMISSINRFFAFVGWKDCCVRHIRVQRSAFCSESRELSRGEYFALLTASREDPQLQLILQTICATGIRVSELRYFTVDAIQRGEIIVRCKNKIRTIFIPAGLRRKLLSFAAARKLTKWLFVNKHRQPLDRSTIWRRMKNLCVAARVEPQKVFPHNLRKLFARTFYAAEKDIAKLADILGHSSIETTRIYIMTTGAEHRRKMEKMRLLLE